RPRSWHPARPAPPRRLLSMISEKGAGLLLQNLPPNSTATTPVAATTADHRAHAVERFGYTPRQAGFIVLVAIHSGYFVRRQFLNFAGLTNGVCTVDFLRELETRGHMRTLRYRHHGNIYHVSSRTIYAALDEEHNRHRRQIQVSTLVQKLMALDLVLA